MRAAYLFAMLLVGCERAPSDNIVAMTPSLEAAAIEAGVIPDPATADVTGLYARDDDRMCIVPAARDYRIGLRIALGDQSCTGVGTLARTANDALAIDLGHGCAFDAAFEGDRVRFPVTLPDACRRLCGERGSLAAVMLDRLSETPDEAVALTLPNGRKPCGLR